MRVLHVVPALFGPRGIVGGAERYAFELARHMAAVVPTTLVSFGDEGLDEMDGALRVRVIARPWYVRGQQSNPIAPEIIGEIMRADVVHCHQQHILVSSLCALICRFTDRRIFVSDLGGGGWDISGYVSTDSWYRGHLHISEYSRRIAGHEGRPSAQVILGGVDTERFSPVDRSSQGKVLFVGRLRMLKGVDVLIEAIARLHAQGRPVTAALVGAGADRSAFEAQIARCGLSDAIRFAGAMPARQAFALGSVLVVPSRAESLPYIVLEGAAAGKPMVTTNVGGIPEIYGQMADTLIAPNDPGALAAAIARTLDHPQQAYIYAAALRDRVSQAFSVDHMVDGVLAAYAEALAAHAPKQARYEQFAASR